MLNTSISVGHLHLENPEHSAREAGKETGDHLQTETGPSSAIGGHFPYLSSEIPYLEKVDIYQIIQYGTVFQSKT